MKAKKKFTRILNKIDTKISFIILSLIDGVIDLFICKKSLVKYVPSIFRDEEKGIGGTGSQSTFYFFLKRVFSNVEVKDSDIIMDVGCGKGRVIAFLLKHNKSCRLFGIEHNGEIADIAREWTKRYERVQIFTGDALKHDYNPYTVLTLGRPFLPKTFSEFLNQVEKTVDHPITLVSWYEIRSIKMLKDRPGWTLVKSEKVSRIHGLRIAINPQPYSVWKYEP